MSKLFRRQGINIYSIEPVSVEEASFDPVLEVLETAIEAVAENFCLTYWEAFKALEEKMEEARNKHELRYRSRQVVLPFP